MTTLYVQSNVGGPSATCCAGSCDFSVLLFSYLLWKIFLFTSARQAVFSPCKKGCEVWVRLLGYIMFRGSKCPFQLKQKRTFHTQVYGIVCVFLVELYFSISSLTFSGWIVNPVLICSARPDTSLFCLQQLTWSLLAVAFLTSFGSSMLYGYNLAVVNSPALVTHHTLHHHTHAHTQIQCVRGF